MKARTTPPPDSEAGQALVLVAMLLVGLMAVAGLAVDGGILFAQRRSLQNVADAAALAGAMQIDEDAYRASGAAVLDQDAAQRATSSYLADGGDIDYSVTTSATGVEVQVSREASTGFLRVVGIESMSISARARAEARHGIQGAQR